MKKCQMHNKKKDKLSYTVTLHYSAVAGSFVYHFLVHLHDFRQRAVGWAMQIFFTADSACPRHHLLLQFGPQPSVHGAATWARRAARQQVPIQQHIPCTCWSNPNVEAQRVPPAFTGEAERGSSHPSTRMMLLVLPQLSRPSEHALEEHKAPQPRSEPHYGVQSTKFITGTNRDTQLWCKFGEENVPTALTPFLVLQLHLLKPPQWVWTVEGIQEHPKW